MNEDKLDKICRLLVAIREKHNISASFDVNTCTGGLCYVTAIGGVGYIVHNSCEEALERLEAQYLQFDSLQKHILQERIIELREELDATQLELSQLGG